LLASHSSVDAQSIYNTAAGAVCQPLVRRKRREKKEKPKKDQEQFCFIDWIHKLNATTNLSGLERFVFRLNFVHLLLVCASTACVVFLSCFPKFDILHIGQQFRSRVVISHCFLAVSQTFCLLGGIFFPLCYTCQCVIACYGCNHSA
jgi:hypothetical protein